MKKIIELLESEIESGEKFFSNEKRRSEIEKELYSISTKDENLKEILEDLNVLVTIDLGNSEEDVKEDLKNYILELKEYL